MKSIKQKYKGMKREELTKALNSLSKSIQKTRMVLRDEPKAYADMYKHRYERALIKTLLSLPDSK